MITPSRNFGRSNTIALKLHFIHNGRNVYESLFRRSERTPIGSCADKGGYVIRRRYFGNLEIKTNNRTFGEQGNPKDQATWESALNKLRLRGLIHFQSREIYRVTKAGYDMAEALTE